MVFSFLKIKNVNFPKNSKSNQNFPKFSKISFPLSRQTNDRFGNFFVSLNLNVSVFFTNGFYKIKSLIKVGITVAICCVSYIHPNIHIWHISFKSPCIRTIKIYLGSGEFHGFANILRIKEKSWNPPYISHLGWYLGSLWHHFQSPKSKISEICVFRH